MRPLSPTVPFITVRRKTLTMKMWRFTAAVQMMADAKAAGVMFTVNLATGADDSIMIEGSWGLGEYIVQGTVTPDNFVVDKDSLTITSRRINEKSIELIRKEGGDVEERKSGTGTCQSAGYKR